MRTRSLGLAFAILGVTLTLAGCQAAAHSTVTCRKPSHSSAAGYVFKAAAGTTTKSARPGIDEAIVSRPLANKISVHDLDFTSTGTGLTQVRVELANCTAASLQVRVRTQFLGDDGRSAEPISAWRDVFLTANGVAEYQEKALQAASRHVRIEVDLP